MHRRRGETTRGWSSVIILLDACTQAGLQTERTVWNLNASLTPEGHTTLGLAELTAQAMRKENTFTPDRPGASIVGAVLDYNDAWSPKTTLTLQTGMRKRGHDFVIYLVVVFSFSFCSFFALL